MKLSNSSGLLISLALLLVQLHLKSRNFLQAFRDIPPVPRNASRGIARDVGLKMQMVVVGMEFELVARLSHICMGVLPPNLNIIVLSIILKNRAPYK